MKNDINQFKNVIDQPENSNLIEQLKKYIPKSLNGNTLSAMNYKILVPNDGAIQYIIKCWRVKMIRTLLEFTGLVEKVKSYLKKYKPEQKKFSIESCIFA